MSQPPLDLIVIPFHDWKKYEREGFRTRDAHLIQHMMRHPRVRNILVIDRPTPPPEMLVKRTSWHVSAVNRRVQQLGSGCRLTHISESVQVLDVFLPSMIKPVAWRQKWIPEAYASSRCVRGLQLSLQILLIGGVTMPVVQVPFPFCQRPTLC